MFPADLCRMMLTAADLVAEVVPHSPKVVLTATKSDTVVSWRTAAAVESVLYSSRWLTQHPVSTLLETLRADDQCCPDGRSPGDLTPLNRPRRIGRGLLAGVAPIALAPRPWRSVHSTKWLRPEIDIR